jgi:predicted lactoylglutathione lyase
MRMIFVNLPIKNVDASRAFFTSLGYKFNAQFSGDTSLCMIIDDNIFVMLLAEAHFSDFITQPISDATKATEVLLALSCESRAEVQSQYAKAIAGGAKEWKPAQDHGFMYSSSFQDLDGHVWELMWMDPSNVQPA